MHTALVRVVYRFGIVLLGMFIVLAGVVHAAASALVPQVYLPAVNVPAQMLGPERNQLAFLQEYTILPPPGAPPTTPVIRNRSIVILSPRGIEKASIQPTTPQGELLSVVEMLWTRDGTKLVFVTYDQQTSKSSLYVAAPDGKNAKKLLDIPYGASIIFAPDEQSYLYIHEGDVLTGRIDGTGSRRLTNNIGSGGGLSWSPDSKVIAFTVLENGHRKIHLMNADGTNQRPITPENLNVYAYTWSPDSKSIAFTTVPSANSHLYVINADGTNQRLLAPETLNISRLSWSPDGKKLVFTIGSEHFAEVAVIDATGQNLRRLSSPGIAAYDPMWSPDGRSIVYALYKDYTATLIIVSPYGTNTREVARYKNANHIRRPQWSPDGRWIMFSSEGFKVQAIGLVYVATGETRSVSGIYNGRWLPLEVTLR